MPSTWAQPSCLAILFLGFAGTALAEPETLMLSGHKDPVRALAFSPDGRLLASSGDDRGVRLWDVESGVEQRSIRIKNGALVAVAWTTDGRYVVYGGDDGHIRLSDMKGREIRDMAMKEEVHSVSASPTGTMFAFGLQNNEIRIYDPASWTFLRNLDAGSCVESTAFSPDGAQLAAGDRDGDVHIFDTQRGKKVRKCSGHTDEVRSLAFNKAGTLLASASQDRTIRLWDPATGRAARTLSGHAGKVMGVAFSPDGSRLASVSADATVMIWDPATGAEKATWETGSDEAINCVAYSPDGKTLATGCADGNVTLWFLVPKPAPPKPEPPKPEPPKPEPPKPEPPKPDLRQITRERLLALSNALKTFEADLGYLPHSVNGGMVNALTTGRRGGYYNFDKAELNRSGEVIDAWGNPLIYRSPGSKGASFDVYSAGPNGRDEGGAGDDCDCR